MALRSALGGSTEWRNGRLHTSLTTSQRIAATVASGSGLLRRRTMAREHAAAGTILSKFGSGQLYNQAMCARFQTPAQAAAERYWSLIDPLWRFSESWRVLPTDSIPIVLTLD